MNSDKFAPLTPPELMNAPKLRVFWGDLGKDEEAITEGQKRHALINLASLPVDLTIYTVDESESVVCIDVDPNPKNARDLALLWTLSEDDLLYSSESFILWIEDYIEYNARVWHGNEASLSEVYDSPILANADTILEYLETSEDDREALVLADRLRGILSGAVRW